MSSVPDQSYFPGAKLRLIIRFDEGGTGALRKQAANIKKPVTMVNGTSDPRTDLTVQPDPAAPAGARRFLLSSPSNSGGTLQNATRSGDGLTHVVEGIIPQQATWGANGIRSADTLSATIRYVDLPFHPLTVRACAVEFYLGTIPEDDFARGISSGEGVGAANPLLILPDTYVDDRGQQRTNLRFQGFVDRWRVRWSAEGEALVELECRDNTRLLLDQEQPPKGNVAVNKPIDEAIADYLKVFPQFQGLGVEFRPPGEVPPTMDGVLAGTAYRPNLGPPAAKGGGASGKTSVMDYLTDVCGALGLTIRVDGTTVIIQRPSTLFGDSGGTRSDDPFKGRNIDGNEFQYRRFIYGRNVLEMECERDYAKHAPSNVEVRSYLGRRKKTLVMRFPENKEERVVTGLPGDGAVDQKWTVFRVSGIEDMATLKVIAETIYQSVGRNEVTVHVKTKNLASFGGGNTDPDVLDMKPGDPFDLLVNRDSPSAGGAQSTIGVIEDVLLTGAADYLRSLGYGGEIVDAYARAFSAAGFLTKFRTKGLSIRWDVGGQDGTGTVELDVTGVNYIEVRADVPFAGTASKGGTPAAAPTAKAGGTPPATGKLPPGVTASPEGVIKIAPGPGVITVVNEPVKVT